MEERNDIYLVDGINENGDQEGASGILGKIVGGIVVTGIAAGGTYLVRKFIKKRKDKKAENLESCEKVENEVDEFAEMEL